MSRPQIPAPEEPPPWWVWALGVFLGGLLLWLLIRLDQAGFLPQAIQ